MEAPVSRPKKGTVPAGQAVVVKPLAWFKPDPGNPRRWTEDDVRQFAAAIQRYGFRVPIACYPDGRIVDGHFRLAAAEFLKLPEVTCIPSDDWTPQLAQEFRLSVNRMGELAAWDHDKLLSRLEELQQAGAPLGDEGPIGFGLEQLDAPAEVVPWDFSQVEDVHVVTVRGPLPLAAEIRERLRGLEAKGVTITEDNLEIPP